MNPPLARPVRRLELRLALMFFVDLAVNGSFIPLLSLHLSKGLGFSPAEIAAVYGVGPLAAMLGPPALGWLADRVLSAERSLALVAILRAGALLLVANAGTFPEMLIAMAALGLVSAPSGMLAFAIAFHHLERSDTIGRTRVFGTVSWIAMLWLTGAYMQSQGDLAAQLGSTRALFYFGAGVSLLSALYALTLPHTPPAPPARAFAFVQALGLLRSRSFRALVLASVLASMCMQFHFMLWPLFFTDPRGGLGLDVATASRASSVAQLLELGLFPALGFLITRFGIRGVLIAGLAAWPARFAAYALGGPAEFVIGAQALHGVNVVCGFITAQIAVDRVAPAGARASSQALLIAATSGAGNLLGQLACGAALAAFSGPSGVGWPSIFALPLGLGLLATVILLIAFRPAESSYTRRALATHV
jgi:MFS family permease